MVNDNAFHSEQNVLRQVPLAPYTTLKIGGIARNLYFPKTTVELQKLLALHPDARIFGGGSNLLINDRKNFDHVVCLREFNREINYRPDGSVVVGSGVRLQKLISDLQDHDLGGIEYLYSVPGLVGGAIYMNAGRGEGKRKAYHQQLSDYLQSVDVLIAGEIRTMSREECEFSYRSSIFHRMDAAILSARFHFEEVAKEEGKKRCQERLELVKNKQDNRYPNAGTTFCVSDPVIMRLFQMTAGGKKEGVHFSDRKSNWLQNRGNGTFEEAEKMIKSVEKAHHICGKECRLEYIIWD